MFIKVRLQNLRNLEQINVKKNSFAEPEPNKQKSENARLHLVAY